MAVVRAAPLHIDTPCRALVRANYTVDEAALLRSLAAGIKLTRAQRDKAAAGAQYVARVRNETKPPLMEAFLAEYGLSTSAGVGLTCLADALGCRNQ